MQELTDLKNETHVVVSTGNAAYDKFLGNNGAVDNALYFIYGEPGASKTTLCQWLLLTLGTSPNNVPIFISNEQDPVAIKENCKRIKIDSSFKIETEIREIDAVLALLLQQKEANPGKQVWACLDALQGFIDTKEHPAKHGIELHIVNKIRKFCKENHVIVFLIGHVNKRNNFSGPNGILHNIDVELAVLNDSRFIRSIATKKNRLGASGNQIRFNLEGDAFEIMADKALWELDFNKKEDQALMPEPMRLLKQNSIAGKLAQTAMREGTGAMKKAIIGGIKNLFKKKRNSR